MDRLVRGPRQARGASRVSRLIRPAAAALVLLAGCQAPSLTSREFVHMMTVDVAGDPVPVRVEPGSVVHEESPARAIAAAFFDWQERHPDGSLMLVFHGGLVSTARAIDEAKATLAAMAIDTADFYPVFINWETSIGGAWVDHTFLVRAGRYQPFWATVTAPFVFAANVGRAIARLPITYLDQFRGTYDYYFRQNVESVPGGWAKSAWIDRDQEGATVVEVAGDLAVAMVPGVLRLVTTPILDGIGTPAHANMRRRARILFTRDQDFDDGEDGPSGLLVELMEALITKQTSSQPLTVDIIAHSMGCVVANDLISRYGQRTREVMPSTAQQAPMAKSVKQAALKFRNVVYMGAACSIRDFSLAVIPYLRFNEEANAYNLCLHPRDEQDDRYGAGTLPHGSLLEWIDAFVTEQDTELDRTLGKWNNVMRALPIVAHMTGKERERLHVRGFGRTPGNPRNHGSFNDPDMPFWTKRFWDPRSDPKVEARARAEMTDARRRAGATPNR